MCRIENHSQSIEIRTRRVKHQIRPSVIEKALLRPQLDSLDLAREPRRRPQVFQTSHELDHAANKRERDLSAEAMVDAVAKGSHGRRRLLGAARASAIGLKLLWVGQVTGIAPCLTLHVFLVISL